MVSELSGDSETEEILQAAAAQKDDAEEKDDVEQQQPPKKKRKSAYRGVYFDKTEGKFVGRVMDGPIRRNMGVFKLETDGALAIDEFKKSLGQHDHDELNFATMEDYHKARALEIEAADDGTQAYGSVEQVMTKIQKRISDINRLSLSGGDERVAKKHQRKCVYRCVTRKTNGKFHATMRYKGTVCRGGDFDLEVDAALAVDEMTQATKGLHGKYNFTSMQRYKDARADELEVRGISIEDVPSADHILSLIQLRVTQIKSDIIDDGGDDAKMTHRNKFTSTYRGVSFDPAKARFRASIILYGKKFNIGDFLLESDAAYAVDETSSALKVSSRQENFESHEAYERAREVELKRIDVSNAKYIRTLAEVQQRIKSRLNAIEATLATSEMCIQQEKPSSGVDKLKGHNLTSLDSTHLSFPKGCLVMADFTPDSGSEFYKQGNIATVTDAQIDISTREIYYTCMYKGTDNQRRESILRNEKDLAYAYGCPVKYSPSKIFDSDSKYVLGKIVLCQPKPKQSSAVDESTPASFGQGRNLYYTVIVFHDGPTGSFKVVQDVASDQIKYHN